MDGVETLTKSWSSPESPIEKKQGTKAAAARGSRLRAALEQSNAEREVWRQVAQERQRIIEELERTILLLESAHDRLLSPDLADEQVSRINLDQQRLDSAIIATELSAIRATLGWQIAQRAQRIFPYDRFRGRILRRLLRGIV